MVSLWVVMMVQGWQAVCGILRRHVKRQTARIQATRVPETLLVALRVVLSLQRAQREAMSCMSGLLVQLVETSALNADCVLQVSSLL